MNIKCSGKRGNLDFERAVFLGHGRIAIVAQRLQLYTHQRLACGQVSDLALQRHHRIDLLGNLCTLGLLDDRPHLFFVVFALGIGAHSRESNHTCADSNAKHACLHKVQYSTLHVHYLLDSSYSTSFFGFKMMAAIHKSRENAALSLALNTEKGEVILMLGQMYSSFE